jgi:membrane-associated phospholipid phosphatase
VTRPKIISAPLGRAVAVLAVTGAVLLAVGLTVGLTLIGRHGDGPVRALDRHVGNWFLDHRYLIGLAKVIATVGDAALLGVECVVLTLALLAWRRTPLMLAPLAGYLGGEGLVYLTRAVVHRDRPPTADYPAPGALAGVHETTWSFPSGHATAVTALLFAGLGVVALTRRALWPWLVAAVGSVYVAASRLDLGVHWFTDVATGWVLGTVWGVTVALVAVRLAAGYGVPANRYERPRHSSSTAVSASGPADGP